MKILGIDPGISGGIAVVNKDGVLMEGWRMPTLQYRKKELVDASTVRELLTPYMPIDVAVIEQVHAMPRQGVSSSFTFGRVTGAIEALAILHAERVEWVTPQKWKKALGLTSDKRASLDLACLTFGSSQAWNTLANDGIAEAALLAHYWLTSRS